jgi:S1-C subfamily serine protease
MVAGALAVLLFVLAVGAVGFATRPGSGFPGFGVGAPKPLSDAQVLAMVRPSVVSVKVMVFRGDVSEGSGFFYGKPGHVLTSAHVITRALSIKVIDSAGKYWAADLIGIDRSRDVAELKVPALAARPIKPATRPAKAGGGVLVTGIPAAGSLVGAWPATVTRGMVGGLGQDLTVGSKSYHNLIQTDAVVNQGNSGGPIVNGSGELLAMAILGEGGQAFGIPVADFASLARDWTTSDSVIPYGPPLVAGPAAALVLASGAPNGFAPATSEAWNGTGQHVVYRKPADYDYGGESIAIYLDVKANQYAAQGLYQNLVKGRTDSGFTTAGSSAELGDEMTWMQNVVKDQVTHAVIWRDRNVVVLLYLGSGIPARPEVSLDTALSLARMQAKLVAADLASFE